MNWNFLVLVLNHRIVGILATAIGVIAMVYFNFWILFISIFIIEWQILIACLEPKQDLIKKYSSLMWFLRELSCIDKNITLIIPEHENVAKKFNNLNEKINNINNNIYNLLEQNTSLTLIQKEFLELFKETNCTITSMFSAI